jgi:hypothetical protein
MIIFLLTFFCLYGGIHVYAYSRASSLFHFSGIVEAVIIILLVLLTLAPLLVRVLESRHFEATARIIAYIGYLWMAFIFLLFCLNLSLDAVRLLAGLFYNPASSEAVAKITFSLAVFLSFVLVTYGYFDAQNIRISKLEIHTSQQLPNDGRIRITQISDLPIGLIVRGERLRSVLALVEETKPDIFLSTGDLLDGELNNVMHVAKEFARIKPKYGRYAITGNHEYYAGIEKALEFTRNAGFDVLRDEARQVGGITIVGIDDITGRRMGLAKNDFDLGELLQQKNNEGFILLLCHQPLVYENAKFNLQLSGHTHGGQIFPFNLVIHLFFAKNRGYFDLGKNKALYVSRGTGTWGPPVRIFSPPEITVIDLISGAHPAGSQRLPF